MVMLLALPTDLSSPLFNKPRAIGFDKGLGFIVLWFEEEGDAEDGERYGARGVWVWVGEYFVDCFVEMFFPNVSVGS